MFSFICFVILIFHTLVSEDSVLAKVDNQFIYTSELKNRYQSYVAKSGVKDNLILRKQILDNIINEKLILVDAKKQKWYFAKYFREQINLLKEVNLISEYYSKSFDTISISEKELRIAFINMNTKIKARHLYANSFEKALILKSRLSKGESFEKLAKEVFTDPILKNNGGDLGIFSIGEMDPEIEKVAFTMKEGEISDPIKTDDGFSLLKIDKINIKPILTESEFATKKNKVEEYCLKIKKSELSKNYSHMLAQELNINFNSKIIKQLFKNWQNSNTLKLSNSETPNSFIDKNKNQILLSYKNENITINDFMQLETKLNSKQKKRVRTEEDFKNIIIGLLVRKEIIIKANQMHSEESIKFRNNFEQDTILLILNTWKDDVINKNLSVKTSNYFLKKNSDQINFNKSVKNLYLANKQNYIEPEQVNVAEIYSLDINKSYQVIDSLKLGKNFSQLAARYSERLWSARQNGELGFGDRQSYGIYADTLFNLPINKIIGPLQIGNGYSIFKILDKKKSRQKKYDEVKFEIANEVYKELASKKFLESIKLMRDKSLIEINNSLVEELIMQ
ncbi:MAG: peptidylprolyl isomerase [Bacteroidetes bacterium]|nr:peptidylprolyl isomerase [Bacteroidota bacterium]